MRRDRQGAIDRAEAELLLAAAMVPRMSQAARASALADAWQWDSEQGVREAIAHGRLPQLSNETIALIATTDSPPTGPFNGRDALLLDWCRFELRYVTNAYLEDALALHGKLLRVHGAPREAGLCPCCSHYSINAGEDGICDICPVCGWENLGEGPNHMSLEEGRRNFATLGAMSMEALQQVDPDGRRKYLRDEGG